MAISALKVPQSVNGPSSPSKFKAGQLGTPSNSDATANSDGSKSKAPLSKPEDVSSPHELTAYVETLLDSLESKFDDMSKQILDRMDKMSSRVDALEASIQDIINGDIAVSPQPPSPKP